MKFEAQFICSPPATSIFPEGHRNLVAFEFEADTNYLAVAHLIKLSNDPGMRRQPGLIMPGPDWKIERIEYRRHYAERWQRA